MEVDNGATTPPDVIAQVNLSNPSTATKNKLGMMNHPGVPTADSTLGEQNSQLENTTTQNHALLCHHPRVPGDDVLTHHSHPQEEVPPPTDQGTDDCLQNLGHLKLDSGAEVYCNPTQADQPSTSPDETPPPQLPSGELQAVPSQHGAPLRATNHPEGGIQVSPINVPNGVPVMPLPDSTAKADRESDCPPPQMVDASHFNGKASKEKEVSPPKRTRFSELHPYAIVSLFDGVGSAIPAIARAVGGPPSIIIAAECDPILRQFFFSVLRLWPGRCTLLC